MLELLFVSILTSKILKYKIYAHQKLTIFICLIPLILKIIVIPLSFFDKDNIYEGDLKILYTQNPICLLAFILYNALF